MPHVDPHDLVIACTCLSALQVPRQRFISSWLQGRLQLSGGEHPQQEQHGKEQSTLTTRLRRRLINKLRYSAKIDTYCSKDKAATEF